MKDDPSVGQHVLLTGVYQIRNVVNNKVYIGSTAQQFSRRKAYHLMLLRRNRHHSPRLQRAFNKYGERSFVFEILEQCPPEISIAREQYWLDVTRSFDKEIGYNVLAIAGSSAGRILTTEHKRKISESEKGKVVSAETRSRNSLANKARVWPKRGPLPQQTRDKIGAANRGKKRSSEIRSQVSAKLKGRKPSTQCIEAIKQLRSKRVGCFEPQTGQLVEEFASCNEAQRKYGWLNQGISRACLTGWKYKGYHWRYL